MSDHGPDDFKNQVVQVIPNLRAFARSLVNDAARADDLVQNTLMRALSNADRFEDGTNLQAWLFTILRNLFYSELRKKNREVEDPDGTYASSLTSPPNQLQTLELNDFRSALSQLPSEQREALILVGASGFSHEEAAHICDCAIGTIKSRVNRGRAQLAKILQNDPSSDLGSDRPKALASRASHGQAAR